MREREIVREPVAEREIIIDETPSREYIADDRPPRGGGGAVAAIIGILLVLLLGWFLVNALGALEDPEVNVDAPPVEVEGDIDE
jgi:hypothetical protein